MSWPQQHTDLHAALTDARIACDGARRVCVDLGKCAGRDDLANLQAIADALVKAKDVVQQLRGEMS